MSRGPVPVSNSLLGLTVDSLEFARQSRILDGVIAIAELPRLHDLLIDLDGLLSVRLRGERDGERRSWLHMEVEGTLSLRCQRCLGGIAFPLALSSCLELVPEGRPWPDESLEDDSFDAIAADSALQLRDLVEEEVILALPLAPVHGNCDTPAAVERKLEDSPFAALGVLKKY